MFWSKGKKNYVAQELDIRTFWSLFPHIPAFGHVRCRSGAQAVTGGGVKSPGFGS